MIGVKHGSLAWLTCLVLAVGLGLSAPAAGSPVVTGQGLIVEKNVEKGLLTLDTGVVLEVTATAKIISAEGKRITLADLAVASALDRGGMRVAGGDAMVHYKGRSSGGRVSAYSIRVVGRIPH